MRLPILHIPPDEAHALAALCDALAARDVLGLGVSGLIAGAVPLATPSPVLLTTADTRLPSLARWSRLLAHPGYASLLFCVSERLLEDCDGHLSPSDLPLLTGHGVVLASRGVTGEPLVGLSPGRLREELKESRRQLSDAAGYPVNALAPAPNAVGRAFDNLVLREARRAGYTLFLKPGAGGAARVDRARPDEPMPFHEWGPSDTPSDLADWAAGDLVARGATRLRGLLDTPRRLLRRVDDQ